VSGDCNFYDLCAQDLAQLAKMYEVADIISTPCDTLDVVEYYDKTTDRDYKMLQFFHGPGLHSTLCLKSPVGMSAATSVQPAMILGKIAKFQCQRVLEAGCGQGSCTLFLAILCPDVVFKGIDIVPRHINIAKSYQQRGSYKNADFELCDATKLDALEGEKFDLIFSVEGLCHLDTVQKRTDFLTHVSKRLSATGKLVIIDGFRSPDFAQASPEQQMAMQLAEKGFRINEMATKQWWKCQATEFDFTAIEDMDLTREVLPFWKKGWRMAHFLLNFARVLRYIFILFPTFKESSWNFLSVATTAHALRDSGAAEYGLLVFQKGQN